MGNVYFAKDQAGVFLDTCILGNMTYPIRKPEVQVIHKALKALDYGKYSNYWRF